MEVQFVETHNKNTPSLIMDYDSGYVEGAESVTQLSDFLKENVNSKVGKDGENFLISEDALLEKPDIFSNVKNFKTQIDNEDYEETRILFFSPSIALNDSASSKGINEQPDKSISSRILQKTTSNVSVHVQGTTLNESSMNESASDMSLEVSTYEPVIIERNANGIASFGDIGKINLFKNYPHESAICSNQENQHLDSTKYKSLVIKNQKFEENCFSKNIQYTNNSLKNSKEVNETIKVSDIIKSPTSLQSSDFSKLKHSMVSLPELNCSLVCSNNNKSENKSKDNKRLTLVFTKSDDKNNYLVKRKYPSLTPEKKFENQSNPNLSPDIFTDEIDDKVNQLQNEYSNIPKSTMTNTSSDHLDKKFLKLVQKEFSGVLPPPSVTIVNMSACDMLRKIKTNNDYFWNITPQGNVSSMFDKNQTHASTNIVSNSKEETTECESKTLLINTDTSLAQTSEWPDVLNIRSHGLHYNRSSTSEEIETLCEKYQKRFIGAETHSSCTVFETFAIISPAKRRLSKSKWGTKSPGRRLSHLARRRITFSSVNLQAGGSLLAGSRARQILVDAKKVELFNRLKSPRKSPKKFLKRTPKKSNNKSPKIKSRTPSSSAKKKLAIRFRKLAGEIEKSIQETSEESANSKVLIQSPENLKRESVSRDIIHKGESPNTDKKSSLLMKPQNSFIETFTDKNKLRRALFASPKKSSPSKSKISPFNSFKQDSDRKRKRSVSSDKYPSKFARSNSMDVRPTQLDKNLESRNHPSCSQIELNISLNNPLQQELSEEHKKKLQWAVYGALQSQNINRNHPQFKVYASVLARVTRRFFASQMTITGLKPQGSTTERMHRIARHHVFEVIKGKTADEIVADYVKTKSKVQKPQGYVAPEGLNLKTKAETKAVTSTGKENVFRDRVNTIESWEKKKLEQGFKARTENRIERIRKVINFGDEQ